MDLFAEHLRCGNDRMCWISSWNHDHSLVSWPFARFKILVIVKKSSRVCNWHPIESALPSPAITELKWQLPRVETHDSIFPTPSKCLKNLVITAIYIFVWVLGRFRDFIVTVFFFGHRIIASHLRIFLIRLHLWIFNLIHCLFQDGRVYIYPRASTDHLGSPRSSPALMGLRGTQKRVPNCQHQNHWKNIGMFTYFKHFQQYKATNMGMKIGIIVLLVGWKIWQTWGPKFWPINGLTLADGGSPLDEFIHHFFGGHK